MKTTADALVVARFLKAALGVTLGALVVGLTCDLIWPERHIGDWCIKYGLLCLVLTPPSKSLMLGIRYWQRGERQMATLALAVFIIVMIVWWEGIRVQ